MVLPIEPCPFFLLFPGRTMSRPTVLNEKHWKALELLGQDMSRENVAKTLGWSKGYLDRLCTGDTRRTSNAAPLFKAEYLRTQLKNAEETKKLTAANMRMAQKLIGEVFAEINQKKVKTDEDKALLSKYTNAIAKCQPNVNIKNLSYSYTKGLTAEELVHEFKRLKTVAESSFDARKTIPAEESVDQNVTSYPPLMNRFG